MTEELIQFAKENGWTYSEEFSRWKDNFFKDDKIIVREKGKWCLATVDYDPDGVKLSDKVYNTDLKTLLFDIL